MRYRYRDSGSAPSRENANVCREDASSWRLVNLIQLARVNEAAGERTKLLPIMNCPITITDHSASVPFEPKLPNMICTHSIG
jgi:hypothetical protein